MMSLDQMQRALADLGFCAKCGEEIVHAVDEPIAHCSCGAQEWTGELPLTSQGGMTADDMLRVLKQHYRKNA